MRNGVGDQNAGAPRAYRTTVWSISEPSTAADGSPRSSRGKWLAAGDAVWGSCSGTPLLGSAGPALQHAPSGTQWSASRLVTTIENVSSKNGSTTATTPNAGRVFVHGF